MVSFRKYLLFIFCLVETPPKILSCDFTQPLWSTHADSCRLGPPRFADLMNDPHQPDNLILVQPEMWAFALPTKYPVLIIDDIGYVKKRDGKTQILFEFIAHRYESGSLIVTFSQWDQIFPDSLMTVAAVDRIIHHASIIEKKQHLQK